MNDHSEPAVIEVTIAAPVNVVWEALRDVELLRRWHGWQYDGLDDEIRTIYRTGVTEVTEDPEALILELGDQDRFSLRPTDGGVVVRVTRAPYGANPEWDAYYDDVTEGWRTFLQQLRFAVERHQLADRRTVALNGELAHARPIVEALGLAGVAKLPVGSAYRVICATGEELSGQVWAALDRQLMLTVDGAGDGLLVLADHPRIPGSVQVLLTTYGLDDDAFSAAEARWTAWWATAT